MRGELDFAESLRAPGGGAGRAARVGARRGGRASWSSPRARAPRSARSSGSGSAAGWCPAGSPRSSPAWPRSWGWTSAPPTSWRSSTGGSPAGSSARSSTGRARRWRCAGSPQAFGVPLEQCVAVGDGANDIDMLVHRRARHRVQRQARAARGGRHRAVAPVPGRRAVRAGHHPRRGGARRRRRGSDRAVVPIAVSAAAPDLLAPLAARYGWPRAAGPAVDPARAGRRGPGDAGDPAAGAAARRRAPPCWRRPRPPRSRSASTRAPSRTGSGTTPSPPGWPAASARSPGGPAARTGRRCRSCRG